MVVGGLCPAAWHRDSRSGAAAAGVWAFRGPTALCVSNRAMAGAVVHPFCGGHWMCLTTSADTSHSGTKIPVWAGGLRHPSVSTWALAIAGCSRALVGPAPMTDGCCCREEGVVRARRLRAALYMAFVTECNRPQPFWQPPPTAYLTAFGAASEGPSHSMHPDHQVPFPCRLVLWYGAFVATCHLLLHAHL